MRAAAGSVRRLFEPVDDTPLVLFRVVFGLLIALEAFGAITTGWVHANLIAPRVHFPLVGLEWLRPPPAAWMYAWYAAMAACGVLVMLGCFFRLALAAFAVLWAGVYALQTISYNNHYYLLLLLALLVLATPAHAWLSV